MNGQFEVGNIPWNKDLKGIHLSSKSEFKKGMTKREHPSWKGGIQKSRDGVIVYTGINKRTRRSRKNYIDHYGEIPSGYIIYHLDGNKDNDNINNLEAISRRELLRRNSGGKFEM